MKKKDELIG